VIFSQYECAKFWLDAPKFGLYPANMDERKSRMGLKSRRVRRKFSDYIRPPENIC